MLIKILKNIYHRLRHFSNFIMLYVKWFIFKPPIPKSDKVMLNLGCGLKSDSKFINIDIFPYKNVHYIRDVKSKKLWEKEAADMLYASHVLEHIRRNDLIEVLGNWYSFLKKGGRLRISVPDFDNIVKIYALSNRDINKISSVLMGGQESKYNIHYVIFNKDYLVEMLLKVGFVDVYEWDPNSSSCRNIDDYASAAFNINGTSVPISLNLEAIK